MTTFTHIPEVPTTVDLDSVEFYNQKTHRMMNVIKVTFSGSADCSPVIPVKEFINAIVDRESSKWENPLGVYVANSVHLTVDRFDNNFFTLSFYAWSVRMSFEAVEAWLDENV